MTRATGPGSATTTAQHELESAGKDAEELDKWLSVLEDDHDEVAEIGVSQSKQILSGGVKHIEAELSTKQKSLVWSWGMSEDNLDIKAKVLIHAAAQFYNISMSTEEALKVIKEFFEIYEPARSRKVGEHPGARLKTLRSRKK